MEYVVLRGAVRVKADANSQTVLGIVDALQTTLFVDPGECDVRFNDRVLRLHVEGVVSDCDGIATLISLLQSQTSSATTVDVSSVRWETSIRLRSSEFDQPAACYPL